MTTDQIRKLLERFGHELPSNVGAAYALVVNEECDPSLVSIYRDRNRFGDKGGIQYRVKSRNGYELQGSGGHTELIRPLGSGGATTWGSNYVCSRSIESFDKESGFNLLQIKLADL